MANQGQGGADVASPVGDGAHKRKEPAGGGLFLSVCWLLALMSTFRG